MLKERQEAVAIRGECMPHRRVSGFPSPLEFFKPELIDDEFHPGLIAVLPIAQGIEYFDDGFNARNQLIYRGEFTKHLRDTGSRTQPATGHHSKTDGAISGLRGEQADVMNRRERAIMPTPGKRDLKLARQALVQRIA